jgi:serine/threonine protein kinase
LLGYLTVETMTATLLQAPISSVTVNPNCSKLAGRYQVIEQLGEGGFAETYLALDTYLPDNYRCVVKKLKVPTSDDVRQYTAQRLFGQEAAALHQLGDHPQIPKLLAYFQQGEESYLIEEYIEGHSLSQELQPGKRWETWSVLQLLQDLLKILTYVHHHQGGYIHRDIKPSNIIRRQVDQKLVLIDFGSVKAVSGQDSLESAMGQTVIVGTIGYMPTEQLQGNPRRSSDLYAVGMIALYTLTGMNPAFEAFSEDPQTGTLKWRDYANVSPDLAEILDRMISNDISQRYSSAMEALNAIQSIIISYQVSCPTILKSLPSDEKGSVFVNSQNIASSTSNSIVDGPEPPIPTHTDNPKTPPLLPFLRGWSNKGLRQQMQASIGFRAQLLLLAIGLLISVTAFHHLPWHCSPQNSCPANSPSLPSAK